MNARARITLAVFMGIAPIMGGCGGGGGSQPQSDPPVISSLTYSPHVARVSSTPITVNGSVEFHDSGGNLASVTLTIKSASGATVSSVTTPVQGAAGLTSGTLNGAVQVTSAASGAYTIQVSATDTAGAISNILNGTFQVVAISSEAKVVVQTGPGPSALTASNGVLYWAETGDDAIRSISASGGNVTTLAQRMPEPLSVAFSGTDTVWLASETPSAACDTRELLHTTLTGASAGIASGSACAIGAPTTVDLVVLGLEAFWVSSTGSPDTYTINATPVSGGTTTTIATSNVPIAALAGYGSTLYWMARDPSTGSSGLFSVPASGGRVTAISSGFTSSSAALAVDSVSAYYASQAGAGVVAVMAQPLGGGVPIAVTSSASVQKLAVVDQTLVWSGPESLQSAPTGGGVPYVLATYTLGRLQDFMFDGAHVFWSETNDGVSGVIKSVPIAGGAASTVYQGALASRFELDGTGTLYWIENGLSAGCDRIARLDDMGKTETAITGIESSSPIVTIAGSNLVVGDLGCIKTIPLNGGVPTIFPAGSATIVSLTASADGQFVYWVNLLGTVDRLRIADGSVTAIAGPGTASALPSQPGGILLASDGNLYWISDPQTVLSASAAAANASPTVIAEGLQRPTALAADNSNLYISDQTGILKKPLGAAGTPALLISDSTPGGITQLLLDGSTLYWLNGAMLAKANTDGSQYAEVIEFDSTGTPTSSGPAPPRMFALGPTSAYFTEPLVPDIRATPK